MLMDNGLDLGIFFAKKRLGFGFGFPVMGRVGFGPKILPSEGLYLVLNLKTIKSRK